MNLLCLIEIVDGNVKKASEAYSNNGMLTQYQVYEKVLKKLSSSLSLKLNITIIHPAITKHFMPSGLNINDFQGIVWTGSLLNIYDSGPSIERQIELAKHLLHSICFIPQ